MRFSYCEVATGNVPSWGNTTPDNESAIIAYLRATELNNPNDSSVSTTNIDAQLETQSITLFPNPTDDVFEIHGLIGEYTIRIIDVMGNVHNTINSMGSYETIFLASLPAGLYFVHLENNTNSNVVVQKILKTN